MNSIRTIFLADDHELVVNGIAGLIQKSIAVDQVDIFKNGKLLFDSCMIKKPDLVFLDYEMPVWDGLKTLVQLKEKFPKIPVLILSMLNEKSIIEHCISQGANGYLNKDCSVHEITEAIHSVMNGEIYYSREALKILSGLSMVKTANSTHLNIDLSPREKEILVLLCDGQSPKEIADKLFLSSRTVEKHKDNIMQKFEVNSVVKLISIALKNKMV